MPEKPARSYEDSKLNYASVFEQNEEETGNPIKLLSEPNEDKTMSDESSSHVGKAPRRLFPSRSPTTILSTDDRSVSLSHLPLTVIDLAYFKKKKKNVFLHKLQQKHQHITNRH